MFTVRRKLHAGDLPAVLERELDASIYADQGAAVLLGVLGIQLDDRYPGGIGADGRVIRQAFSGQDDLTLRPVADLADLFGREFPDVEIIRVDNEVLT